MSIHPTPASSTSRGDVVLQPNYFTSSIYVKALRDDVSTLVLRYHEAYSQPGMTQPFPLFKTVWLSMGWNWLQFKVFDNRSRQSFLDVTTRLFLERTVKTEAPFTRAVALFGMYIFFYTQVKDSAPPLHHITNIPIPCDHYASLLELPEALTSPNFIPLQPHVRYIVSRLRTDLVFFILPKSELGSMNPRELPRELYADDGVVFSEPDGQKRKGRPPRREKGKKARLALDELDEFISHGYRNDEDPTEMAAALEQYDDVKRALLDEVGAESVEEVGQLVAQHLREARELVDGRGSVGVENMSIFELCK